MAADYERACGAPCFFHLVPGKYHCPVLYSVFTNNSHIVANKVTGNVFSHEVGELALSLNGPSNKWLKHIFFLFILRLLSN